MNKQDELRVEWESAYYDQGRRKSLQKRSPDAVHDTGETDKVKVRESPKQDHAVWPSNVTGPSEEVWEGGAEVGYRSALKTKN